MKELNSVSYVAPRNASVFTIIADEVHEVRINKVIFVVEKDEDGEPRIKVAHYEVENNKNEKGILPYETRFFDSLDAYRDGEEKEKRTEKGRSLLRSTYKGGNWYFNGVEALEFEPADNITSFAHTRDGFEIIEGNVPEQLYLSKYEVYAYNDIPAVDIDGKQIVKEGYLKPLLFNEKQKEIMERFKNISQEMTDAGIRLITIESCPYFVNGERISDGWLEYDKGDDSLKFVPAKEHCDHSLSIWWQSWEDVYLDFKLNEN